MTALASRERDLPARGERLRHLEGRLGHETSLSETRARQPARLPQGIAGDGRRTGRPELGIPGQFADPRRPDKERQQALHPAVDEWWSEPARYLRYEARTPHRRPVPPDRDQGH